MSDRERLTSAEQYLAYLIGLGIALAIIAALLIGFGSASGTSTRAMLLVGLALAVIGIAAWLYLVRPWTKFDDLTTPYYTGHEDHAEAGQPGAVPPPSEPETAEEARMGGAVPADPPRRAARPEPAAEAGAARAPGDSLEAGLDRALATDEDAALEGALDSALDAAPDAAQPETGAALEASLDRALEADADSSLEADLDAALDAAPEDAPEEAPPALPAPEPVPALPEGPAGRDNLQMIEGLGPKSQQVLYEAGITTYRAVAESTPAALTDLIRAAGMRLVNPGTWPEQAALLAAGDQDGFLALKDTLRGGRRVT